MRTATSRATNRSARRTTPVPFELHEWKLSEPHVRPGLVRREALLARLSASSTSRLVSVVAPPGYGKTTLLAQWAMHDRRPFAWVTVDEQDNDSTILASYLAVAIHRIAAVDPSVFEALATVGGALSQTAVSRLGASLMSLPGPMVLVLDDVHLLSRRECMEAVMSLVRHLPEGSQFAISSREEPALPLPRLRSQGEVMEVGADELAMDSRGAALLLSGAGVHLTEPELIELTDRTEGWPVALYLAALARKSGPAERGGTAPAVDRDRFLVDYLHSEFLSRLSPRKVRFLTRTAVLDRMSGALCDAVLGSQGSARTLESLHRSNLLVVPLDRERRWYRYHHLFRELLLVELDRREPEQASALNFRAAEWCKENGAPDAALDYAMRAGDTDRVAHLILDRAQPVWASGRVDTVLRWMEWFEGQGVVDCHPEVAVHGALIFALLGRPSEAERWVAYAERSPPVGTSSDGSTMKGVLAYLRALLSRDGIDQMRRDARIGWDGLSPGSPYRPAMLHTEALSYLLEGDIERADAIFARAFDSAVLAGALPLAALILTERCNVACARDDWSEVISLCERAISIVQQGHFDGYWTSALVYAWAARAALHRGEVDRAREYVARGARLRPLLTYVLPVVSAQALLELSRAYIGLADTGGAQAVLRQTHDILQQRPELGTITDQTHEMRSMIDTIRGSTVGASGLTTAELRLLPLLSTHLSFKEIGQRLYVSQHTVKSQAISIYRKLGVTSRSEAIERVKEIGLLEV